MTNETIEFNGRILHRIKALRDFDGIEAGKFGGWVENNENLSQNGNAWIGDNAKVFGNAHIFGNAWIGAVQKFLTVRRFLVTQ